MNVRLERILVKLAKFHAPHLIHHGDDLMTPEQRVPKLARQLASYNILVMMGHLHTGQLNNHEAPIQTWVNEYGRLYNLLARSLFPSLTAISAQYADDKMPPIIVIRGEATPVIHCLAGYVTPYMAARQGQWASVSEAELMGLMDILLDYLEAADLPRDTYNMLRTEGIATLKRMLALPVRQIGITPFDRPIFGPAKATPAPPEKLPEQDQPPTLSAPPPQPDPRYELPRLEEEFEPTPTEELFRHSIPLSSGDTGRRRLPVPDLPDDDEEEK